MKRVRLKNEYHDARLTRIRFDDDRLTFETDLYPPWNNKVPERGILSFENVKNMDEIRAAFSCETGCKTIGLRDQIIGIARIGKRRYLVDLQNVGALEIACEGISEF